ncbi:hypothetical protein GC098_10450 [Paenibacillus sp. LMG 31458]|uniref:Uncharacterized protein n=1 Tax=Paenibacillus phytorum TaxID=2654977 RepID=A0ABX1XTH8_9BACL|nr:hypothetical protein [Paenibacillus phytorum]
MQFIPEQSIVEKLVHGPLADATSHIGQLTMLRRLSGSPVAYINYSQTTIYGWMAKAEGHRFLCWLSSSVYGLKRSMRGRSEWLKRINEADAGGYRPRNGRD